MSIGFLVCPSCRLEFPTPLGPVGKPQQIRRSEVLCPECHRLVEPEEKGRAESSTDGRRQTAGKP